ncbi:MAG: FtsQ-type POTRA domain-containing protein [Ruminococcaceae bacterium]|nr:FtsQ-type POTRA domain-containing protein [Oscillospiraceae bacterium]
MTYSNYRRGCSAPNVTRRDRPYYYRPSNSPPLRSSRRDSRKNAHGRASYLGVIAGLLLTAAVVGSLLFGFFSSYFDVSSIGVTGLSGHSAKEIIAASGIEQGKKLYSVDAKGAEKKILALYPEIASVDVKKVLPSEISIVLTYETPKYFVEVTGEYFTLSESLRVLEKRTSRKSCEAGGLIYLEVPGIKRSVTGEKLQFFGEENEYVGNFLSILSDSPLADDVDRIYIGGKFDVSLVKKGKYRIELGDLNDEMLKLKMAEKVLDAGGYRDLEGVVLNVSDVSESSVSVQKTLKIE